jgi:NhaC family Na+:H+ antiporter
MNVDQEQEIIENTELNIWEALSPVIALIIMLAFNVFVFGDNALSGSNQFILLMGGAVAAIVGFYNKVSYKTMMDEVGNNLKSTSSAILILLMVGALAASWLISGIIPSMVYYGLKILNPQIFFPATVIICSIISIATGSSWTTSATVGIALVGIGKALGLPAGMIAGAVISGAYFGDKLSPLSDTTNLASAMAGSKLFDHIRYMLNTTVPSILITLVIFTIIGLTQNTSGAADYTGLLNAMDASFNINGWLFIVPAIVIFMIVKRTQPLIALLVGTLLGAVFAIIFQPQIVQNITSSASLSFISGYKGILTALTEGTAVETPNASLNDLFSSGGMAGMLGTIWLIICALVFGGVMEAIGALSRISGALLSIAKSTFGLFASTVASCLAINVSASDQYLAIVVPGKMFAKAYEDKDLAPENLSRTLEDSGTVTSVLIPWNTCGAYQSSVLGVSVLEYFAFAIFNYVSPFMTLFYALFSIKIKQLVK